MKAEKAANRDWNAYVVTFSADRDQIFFGRPHGLGAHWDQIWCQLVEPFTIYDHFYDPARAPVRFPAGVEIFFQCLFFSIPLKRSLNSIMFSFLKCRIWSNINDFMTFGKSRLERPVVTRRRTRLARAHQSQKNGKAKTVLFMRKW